MPRVAKVGGSGLLAAETLSVLAFDMSVDREPAKLAFGRPLDGEVSEVIGPLPQIAPKSLKTVHVKSITLEKRLERGPGERHACERILKLPTEDLMMLLDIFR